jgi:hypothetical protein
VTDFEDFYLPLLQMDPTLRRRWLLEQRPVELSRAHWWFGLIDSAVSDVRREREGWPRTRPRADAALAAALIDWALEEGFPIEFAVGNLVQLIMVTLAAGLGPDALPANAQPDSVGRLALARFGFTRTRAITRAAELRSRPVSGDDYVRPGEDVAEMLRLLSRTDDYKDYHRLLGIERMLNDLRPIAGLLTEPDVAAELEEWLRVLPDLNPVPSDPAAPKAPSPRRTGVVGTRPAAAGGRRLLTMSDGTSALVDPALPNEQLAQEYELDGVESAPVINFCAAVHLDGPFAGQTGYAINELGHRIEFALPPGPDGPIGVYEVTRLATDDQPAELRFVGFGCPVREMTGEELPPTTGA